MESTAIDVWVFTPDPTQFDEGHRDGGPISVRTELISERSGIRHAPSHHDRPGQLTMLCGLPADEDDGYSLSVWTDCPDCGAILVETNQGALLDRDRAEKLQDFVIASMQTPRAQRRRRKRLKRFLAKLPY